MSDFGIFGGLEQHRGRLEQTKENSARLARSHGTWESVGSGELIVPDAFVFGITFIEEPSVEYGASLPDIDGQSQEMLPGSVPRCSGGVYRWVRDSNGFYTGANVFFCVDFGYGGTPQTYTVHHSQVFTGLALKDLPRSILQAI